MTKISLSQGLRIGHIIVALLLLIATASGQENRIVRGTVTESGGGALPGVNVLVLGGNTGTITNGSGSYELNVPGEYSKIQFSFIGYETLELEIGNRTQIDVELNPSTTDLEELVIVGYGIQRKEDLTGSIGTVDADELTRGTSPSLEDALQGKIAGVNIVQTSGSPGAGSNIRIRGIGTINNNAPLYIVDGVQETEYGINSINPADIASIQVLKDASASAIYGARGANGVILISTIKGEAGKQTINFKANYGIQQLTKKLDLTNAEEWITLQNAITVESGKEPTYSADDIEYDTDWWNAVTGIGRIQDYHLSLRGGTESANYNISGGFYDNKGIFLSSGYKRYTIRSNTEFKINDWLKVGQNISAASEFRDRENENSTLSGVVDTDPLTPIYDEEQPSGYGVSEQSLVFQPVAETELIEFSLDEKRISGNFYLDIEPFQGLTVRSTVGGIYSRFREEWYYPSYVYNSLHNADESYYQDLRINETYWFFNTVATYNKEIGASNFTIMLGQEAQSNSSVGIGGAVTGIEFTDDLMYLHSASTESQSLYLRNPVESTLSSLFTRMNYSLSNKYLLTATVRRDGSSRFGPDRRYGVFPSLAAAWKIHEEDFMQNLPAISSLKLRLGWGQIGNQNIGDYRWSSSWENGAYFIDGTEVPAKYIAALGNKEIHWEAQTSANAGINLGLFNNKIYIEADYFVKNTSDMLVYMALPSVSGVRDPQIQNIGELENRGAEFLISYKNYDNPLKYSFGINLSTYKTKVLNLGEIDYFFHGMQRTEVGYPIGLFYGYRTDGYYTDWEDVSKNGFNNARPGDVKYVDMNGDGLLNGDDRTYIGDPNPDLLAGFSTELIYGNISLSMNLFGVVGADVYNSFYSSMHSYGKGNFARDMLNYWTPTNQDTDIPRLGNKGNYDKVSDLFVENGSYLRIQNIRLSYDIPLREGKRKITLTAAVDNIYTLSGYRGLDPEVGNYSNDRSTLKTNTSANPYSSINFGVDGGFFPSPRTISGGIQMTF